MFAFSNNAKRHVRGVLYYAMIETWTKEFGVK